MSRRVAMVVAAVLALPACAIAKQGAMFNAQLTDLQSGSTTRLQLYVLPVYRGVECIEASPCSPSLSGRVRVPAPRVGSVPVVSFRLLGGTKVERFAGTPLDRHGRSLVEVTLPRSRVSSRWAISVRADGRVYPVPIDSPVTVDPGASLLRPAGAATSTGATGAGGVGPGLWVAGTVVAIIGGVLLVVRQRRVGRRLPRRA